MGRGSESLKIEREKRKKSKVTRKLSAGTFGKKRKRVKTTAESAPAAGCWESKGWATIDERCFASMIFCSLEFLAPLWEHRKTVISA